MAAAWDFDPLDLSQGVPHEGYRRLRAEAPVCRTPSGTWFLSRRDDVLACVGAERALVRASWSAAGDVALWLEGAPGDGPEEGCVRAALRDLRVPGGHGSGALLHLVRR